jgi:hypothetical protein
MTTTITTHWSDALARLGACDEAIEWARAYPTPEAAWAACDRGDWMLWVAGRLAGPPGHESRRPLVAASCECDRLALHLVPRGEERPRLANETAEAWVRGEATLDQVRAAATATAAYATAAYAATATAAYATAAYAATAAARAATLGLCANIVRRHYPAPPKL